MKQEKKKKKLFSQNEQAPSYLCIPLFTDNARLKLTEIHFNVTDDHR